MGFYYQTLTLGQLIFTQLLLNTRLFVLFNSRMIPNHREDFVYPCNFNNLADPAYKSSTGYLVQIPHQSILLMTNDTVLSELSVFDDAMVNNPLEIRNPKMFDLLFGLIRGFDQNLTFKSMRVLEETLKSVLEWTNLLVKSAKNAVEDTSIDELRNSVKMILFLGFYLVKITIKSRKESESANDKLNEMMKAKKKKEIVNTSLSATASKYQWSLIFALIKSLSQLNLDKLWSQGDVEEPFFMYYHNMGLQLILNYMTKDETLRKAVGELFNRILLLKPSVLKVIKRVILEQALESETKCQMICQYFSKCSPSDSLSRQVIVQMLGVIKSNAGNSNQNQQMKNLSAFINKVSDKFSQVFLDYFDYFKVLYDSECYFLRNSMTTIIYSIIKSIFKERTQENRKCKESLVSLLLERVYDKHIHARSHTLNVLGMMIEENILPGDIMKDVFKTAIDRMSDVGVNARKRATSLVYECSKAFIFLFKQEDSEKLMKSPEVQKELDIAQINISSLDSMIQQIQEGMKEAEESRVEELEGDLKIHEDKRKEYEELSERYRLYLEILKCMESTLPILECLLNSANTSDVIEAIKLTMLFRKTDIQSIESVLEHVWRLIFHDEPSITNEVINCFMSLYFQDEAFNPDHLIKSFETSDSKKVLCFQKIIQVIMNKSETNFGGFNIHVVEKIWHRFRELVKVSAENSNLVREREAIIKLLLSIFVNNYGFVKSNYIMFAISYIQEHILNPQLKCDSEIIIFFFQMVKYSHQNLDWKVRQHFIFQAMPLVWNNKSYPIHVWCRVLETLIEVGFVACPHPEKFLKTIMIKLIENAEEERNQFKRGVKNEESLVNANLRLYFFLGQMVGKLTELSSDLCDLTREAISKGTSEVRRKQGEVLARTTDQKLKYGIMDQTNNDVLSVEYQGNYIIKEIETKSQKLIESECLKEWVAQTVNSVKKIIKSGSDGSAVQKINVLNFGKLMTSSFAFAKQHVRQLVALMTKCQDQSIKINSIVIFSDAIAQNSSALSPHIQGLLQCVLDKSKRVQITALNAIWYLIMSDILLFQSHVSYMAIVFETQSDEIKEYCKRFLLHKNKKQENFLLRKLPETVNQLSEEMRVYGDKTITNRTFEAYAKEILPEIEKGRDRGMVESVTVNLLDLIKRSLTPLVVRNSCLALSLLFHNERSLMQILESYKTISIKLKDDTCVGYFKDLVARIRRNAKSDSKGDFKDLVDEIEAKFVEHSNETIFHRKSKQASNSENKALQGNKKSEKPKRQPKRKSNKNFVQQDSDSEEGVSVGEDSEDNTRNKKPRGTNPLTKKPIEIDSEQEVIPVRNSSRRATRNARISYAMDLESDQE